jgi:hypothetical protein
MSITITDIIPGDTTLSVNFTTTIDPPSSYELWSYSLWPTNEGDGSPNNRFAFLNYTPSLSSTNNILIEDLNPDTSYTVVLQALNMINGMPGPYIRSDAFEKKTTGGVACFAEGTRVLTQSGYKAIETLTADDRIVTADCRIIAFKRMKTTLRTTTKRTTPYLVQPHAFGHNLPASPVRLSPIHKMLIGKGRWISPEMAAHTNPLVTQCEIGGPITYYHIECENYLQDNLVTEGLTVESFGSRKAVGGRKDIYTWNERLNAYTRAGAALINRAK